MATSISWTDGVGATSLTNGKPVPADRFSQWEPSSPLVGAEEEALGTGQLYTFPFRTEYLVTFELRMIPQSSMAGMLRLQRWLAIGGNISVNTGDAGAHVYATCCRQKGTDPKPRLTDAKNLEYSMTFALRNVAAVPVDFICTY